jgi:hypothetical protein
MLSRFRGEAIEQRGNEQRTQRKLPFRARPARDGGVIPSRICAPYKGRLMRQGGCGVYHRQSENDINNTQEFNGKDSKEYSRRNVTKDRSAIGFWAFTIEIQG